MHSRTLPLLCLSALATAQTLTLPDTANLNTPASTNAVWRTAAGTVQLIYDTTHFTRAGVTGPIVIDRLRFRGADGAVNGGGQVYTNMTVRLGRAATDYAAMSATYASNRGTMGPTGTTTVALQPLTGTWTNDVLVDVDLGATSPPAAFSYDPTLGQDLLIELSFPSAPSPSTLLAAAACTAGSSSTHRARLNAGTTAGPGTVADAGVVVTLGFAGPGGWFDPIAATVDTIGAPCGSQAQSFYQAWQALGEEYDLRGPGFGLTLTPDSATSPTRYQVADTLTPPDLSATALGGGVASTANDAIVSHSPGFTFRFPGGATTTFDVCTNGYVWLGANALADATPSVAEFLGSMARLAPCWFDHHAGGNTTSHPGSGLYVRTDTSGGAGNRATYVTWLEIGQANASAWPGLVADTFQCILRENGVVEFRYGAMDGVRSGAVVAGFARGGTLAAPCVDPGSRDLSHEHVFATTAEGSRAGLVLGVNNRPIMDTVSSVTVVHTLANVPANNVFAALVISFAAFQPGIVAPLGLPGCLQSIQVPQTMQLGVAVPGAWTTIPLNIPLAVAPYANGWFDIPLVTQGVALLDLGGGAMATVTSNALRLNLGLR